MTCDIIIPAKTIDSCCLKALGEIRRHYPQTTVIFVVDAAVVLAAPDPLVLQVVSAGGSIAYKRNLGVERSGAGVAAFLDSDAYPHAGWLEAALAEFRRHPDAAVVGGQNLHYPGGSRGAYYSWLAGRSFLLSTGPGRGAPGGTVPAAHVSTSNMFVRREFYLRAGGMLPEIVTGEDVEFCLRVRRLGGGVLYCPGAKASHKTRGFAGFVKQRFLWGKGVFTVLRHTFPAYLVSAVPFVFVCACALLFALGFFYAAGFYLLAGLLGTYLLVCAAEALRVGGGPLQAPGVLPFIFSSSLVLGAGSLCGLLFGDTVAAYRYYDNRQ